VKYGLNIENQNLLTEKAKSKKDGCYTMRGVAYRVRDGSVTHFAADGDVLIPFGNFNVCAGRLQSASPSFALKALKAIEDKRHDD